MAFPFDPSILIPFLLAVSFVELTPGPNMGYLAALSASEGRAAGFKAVLGVTLGLAVYMIAAVIGVAEVIARLPIVYSVLRWAGVLFLFYLAWEAWNDASESSPGNTQESFAAPFWRGFLANVLNPKAAIFYISLLPGFISPAHGSFRAQAFTLGTLHILVSVVIHSAIVISAAKVGALVADGGRSNILRKSMAVLIGISAVWLAWETRR